MSHSIYEVTGDGATSQFPINFTLGILNRDQVECTVDGISRTFTWITDGLVLLDDDPPENGALIRFTRTTSKTELQHDYSNGAAIEETNLDESNKQNIMLVHEILDGRGTAPQKQDLDMGGYKIINMATGEDDDDAATVEQINTVFTNIEDIITVSENITDVVTVADNITTITTLAGIVDDLDDVIAIADDISTVAAMTSDIETVAAIAANITTVAGLDTEITTVVGISSAISNVSSISSAVSNVSSISSAVSNVSSISANVTTVSGISANVTTVAGISANVTTVAGVASGISTLAPISANITTVAGISANVTTVAGISSAVSTVATNASAVSTVSTNISNVNTVATNIANVNTVAGISANITTVAGISANVTTVAGISSAVSTCATNIADIQAAPDAAANISFVVFKAYDNEPPTSNYATLDQRNSHPVLDFDTTTGESAVFSGILPRSYQGGGVTVYIHSAMTSATSGTVGWLVAFERIGNGSQDIDSDGFASAQTVTAATVPATSGHVLIQSVAFTNGAQMDSIAAGESFRIKITRDVANDTAAGDAELVKVEIKET